MAKKAKEKLPAVVTPTGTAVYPYLNRPDTQFDLDGEYKVGLVLPATDAQGLIQSIDKAMADALDKARQDNPAKAKKIKQASPPYTDVTDDDGNETGEVKFNFKMKAKITTKDGTVITQRPGVFDASGSVLASDVTVGGGSKVKVSAELAPFFTDLVGAGITLRLKAVQVIELVQYQGKTADKYGFKVEEGYTATEPTDNDNAPDDEADF
jgi:hypothetical protein